MEISDIMWKTMKGNYRDIVNNICKEYEENPKYKMSKIYDGMLLVGFGVYYDTQDYRMLEAGYYMGNDKMTFFREWRKMTKGIKKLRACIQKPNTKMVEFYKRMKFKIIGEDLNNYLFER